MLTYSMEIAGLKRELPLCKITDDLYIGAFICFGDAELTVACAREMLKLVEEDSYDYLFTAEAKSIPLIHEMARQSGAKKYFIARKGPKAYMPDPIHVEDRSITTAGVQKLYLGRDDAELICGKRILLMDDSLFPSEPPLSESEFSSPLLGRVFTRLWQAKTDGRPVTLGTLFETLSGDEASHITAICQQPESPQNARQALADYIRIVKTEADKRAGTGPMDPLLAATEKYKDKKGTGGKQ